jgi:hypothetical protein
LKIIRALIGSTIGLITTIVLLLVFEAIGLIDAYLPLSNLLAQYELEMIGDPDALGFWFKIWNLTLFSQVSFYWVFSFDMFHISYIFLFIAMLGGFVVIGIVASSKIELLTSSGMYLLLIQISLAIFTLILQFTLYIGALPPDEQAIIRELQNSMLILGILLPFFTLFVVFLLGLALSLSAGLLVNKLFNKKSKK